MVVPHLVSHTYMLGPRMALAYGDIYVLNIYMIDVHIYTGRRAGICTVRIRTGPARPGTHAHIRIELSFNLIMMYI